MSSVIAEFIEEPVVRVLHQFRVRRRTEGMVGSSRSVCCGGGTRRRDDGQTPVMKPVHTELRTAAWRRRLAGTQYVSRRQSGRGDVARAKHMYSVCEQLLMTSWMCSDAELLTVDSSGSRPGCGESNRVMPGSSGGDCCCVLLLL